jgi:hypothetical protein
MVRILVVTTIMLIALGSLMRRRNGVETLSWHGPVPTGGWVHVRNLNGSVTVESTSGNDVEVSAVERWRGSKDYARMIVKQTGADAYICGVYGKGNDRCDASSTMNHNDRHSHGLFRRRSSATISFTIRVPQGVKVDANTVNGAVTIRDASAEVIARTVNGSVKMFTSVGPARIETVNGSIHADIDSLPERGDVSLKTVNGSVTAELPSALDAEVDLSTVHGRFASDFPATVTGKIDPRHLHGTIGRGGRQLKIETVNGSVSLRKGT